MKGITLMKTGLCAVLAVSLLIGAGGCSKSYPKADTPQQAVANMQSVLIDGDKAVYLDCFEASADQRELMKVMFNFVQSALTFRDKLIDTYGQAAWERFQSDESSGASFSLPEKISPEDVTVTIDGDKATCLLPNEEPQPIHLVRKDGVWRVTMEGQIPPGSDPQKMSEMIDSLTKLVRKYAKKIGDNGMTAEKLDEELGAAMAGDVFGIAK